MFFLIFQIGRNFPSCNRGLRFSGDYTLYFLMLLIVLVVIRIFYAIFSETGPSSEDPDHMSRNELLEYTNSDEE